VLRIWDDRTGSYAELAARPSIPLRVCVHGPFAGMGYSLTDLRVLLVADVLTRVAELRGLQVIAVLSADSLPADAFEQTASALGIHPPAAYATPPEAEALLAGPADVHVATAAVRPGDHRYGPLIHVGPVDPTQPGAGGQAADLETCGDGRDGLALRLVLLSRSHGQPVELTQAALTDAGETLSRWRHRVAEWAREPSRPIPAETAQKLGVAFDDDLNTVAALAVLDSVESDHGMPAGAKFETFAFADRVLGLELVREIGS
jgi:hypothetical protein